MELLRIYERDSVPGKFSGELGNRKETLDKGQSDAGQSTKICSPNFHEEQTATGLNSPPRTLGFKEPEATIELVGL